jgi:hypothetical protein
MQGRTVCHTRQKALNSKEVRNVAVRFPSTDARHPSSLVSSSGLGGVKLPPAFATRMSIGPNSPSIRRRVASTSVKFVISSPTCIERPPASSISFRMEDSAAPSLPGTTALAPYCANDLAIAAPMPRELPVTARPDLVKSSCCCSFWGRCFCMTERFWQAVAN